MLNKSQYSSNSFIDCALDESAHVNLTLLSDQDSTGHHFFALRATLKESSVFKSYSVTKGGATSREDYVVRLLGEGADASLYGAWSLRGQRQHHVNVFMEHVSPNCTSMQKFKGTLSEAARSSFEGKIYVHKEAQKTVAYQTNNNLVLGEKASANSKPNLEIFADDVKASHGTTIGQLDEEQLFYFTARGIPKDIARNLLMQGFCQEIVNLIEDPKLREEALYILA